MEWYVANFNGDPKSIVSGMTACGNGMDKIIFDAMTEGKRLDYKYGVTHLTAGQMKDLQSGFVYLGIEAGQSHYVEKLISTFKFAPSHEPIRPDLNIRWQTF